MKLVKKRRRIKWERVALLGVMAVALVALIIWLISFIFGSRAIIDSAYSEADMSTKLAGEKVTTIVEKIKDEKDEEKEYIIAIHLPELDNEALMKSIHEFKDKKVAEKNAVTYIDYESVSAFDQYESYVIKATTYEALDENLMPIQEINQEVLALQYDRKTKKVIDINNCIRRQAINTIAFENKVEKEQVQLLKITNSGLILDVNGKNIQYSYADHDKSFIMDNEKIPSALLPGYTAIPLQPRQLDDRPMIAFTFDDGPAPGKTERILAALDKVGGRATFYELGYLMENYPETTRAVVEQGSEVASHSYDHDEKWLGKMTEKEVRDDLGKVNDFFFSITGQEISTFRPPFGAGFDEIFKAFDGEVVYWDVDTRDWESRNTESVIKMTKQYTYDGAVVLFHDIHPTTIDAVEKLIPYFDSLGYQFVTVSELYERNGE